MRCYVAARCLPVAQYGTDDGNAALLQRGDESLQGGSGRNVLTGDDNGATGAGGDGLAVGGFCASWCVDDDDVVLVGGCSHERIEDGTG